MLWLILRSLAYHWRSNLTVACGVAVGTAVLTGALLVGDSMRGSLTSLALDRLGRIDEALVTDRFFRAALAEELLAASGHTASEPIAAPTILLNVSLANGDSPHSAQCTRVQLVGCDERFSRLGPNGPKRLLQPREIVLNQPLADHLGVQVGGAVLVRLPSIGAIPADSFLGKKRETIHTQRLTVSEIIPAVGLGRFGLHPTQHVPEVAFVSLAWLQERLDQSERANAIFVSGIRNTLLRPQLADYGLTVVRSPLGFYDITTDRMLLDAAAQRAVLDALTQKRQGEPLLTQQAFTYLANTLACNGRQIPYSTITAIDFLVQPPFGPFPSIEGNPLATLKEGEIALNAWAAESLQATVGDTIHVTYFAPESSEGEARETSVTLRLAAIVALTGHAADRGLTPSVRGITDELTMSEWDPPFPFDAKRIRPADEEYWDHYGPTPKAFIALATGQRLWGSRFGKITSIRTNRDPSQQLRQLDPATLGFVLQPVRQQALAAAAGTTPFGVLFLCFSFFIITAAVLLVALLFRLGIEQRARQIGTLLAVGFTCRQLRRMLLAEGLLVATLGSLLGVPVGVAYAALLLLGLQTWWLAAITTPFLTLHVAPASLLIGFVGGLVVASMVIGFSVRSLSRLSPRQLLSGDTANPGQASWHRPPRRTVLIQLQLILLAIGPSLALLAAPVNEQIRAAMFFLAGALALVCLLLLIRIRLRAGMHRRAVKPGGHNVLRLALQNASRNPGRSTLTIGLVAAASFLIVALSAFRVDPNQQTPNLASGNGGFSLMATSDQPIVESLDTPSGRKSLGFSAAADKLLADCRIYTARVRSGDDASCLNLYRARQPRVLGAPLRFIERGGFRWAERPHYAANPWTLLKRPPQPDADGVLHVPVILEKNTANYALQLWGGIGETFEIADRQGRPVRLEVVALLADSILQGDLIVSETAFLQIFPDTSGYRMFFVETLPKNTAAVLTTFQQTLGDYGLVAETTAQRQAELLAVQNTYLSTFQSLGGLGLLLGTFGLAVVQLRNVLERRGELALLRATGFRRRMLARLVFYEHTALLLLGLGVGLLAALAAVLPSLLTRSTLLPWAALAATMATILAVGLATGALAIRGVLRAPLLVALREERS